jgi:hypothetical protein
LILLILDYGCYVQATIFATLDNSGGGLDERYRSPSYHPLPHWLLRFIATLGLLAYALAFGLHAHFDFGFIFAGLGASYFAVRWMLMRRGIS